MEAKDTVMHLDDIDEGRMPDSYGSLRKALKKQAEISFKAGKQEGIRLTAVALDESKKAGIREVVEWIEDNAGLDAPKLIDKLNTGSTFIPIGTEKWQAKLKEWGIR